MIELFTANTPNGIKIPIALEELGIPYELQRVALGSDRLRSPDFLKVNPNAKIPAIRHHNAAGNMVTLFESGAILIYLAQCFGGLAGTSDSARAQTLSWLFLQVAGLGPAMGNTSHFLSLEAPDPHALKRFKDEAARHLQLLNERLSYFEWLNGESYSVADIAHFSWVRRADYAGFVLDEFPALNAWVERIEARPATKRALASVA